MLEEGVLFLLFPFQISLPIMVPTKRKLPDGDGQSSSSGAAGKKPREPGAASSPVAGASLPSVRMSSFFWVRPANRRVGIFPADPPPSGALDKPFFYMELPRERKWKLTASCRGMILLRCIVEAFNFAVYDYAARRTIVVPIPELGKHEDEGAFGFIVDPIDRQKFRVICVMRGRRVRTYNSDSQNWSAAITGTIDGRTLVGFDQKMEDMIQVDEVAISAKGGLLFWVFIPDKSVLSYDPDSFHFSTTKLPKYDNRHSAVLSESGDQLWYMVMEFSRMLLWSLEESTSSSRGHVKLEWDLKHKVELSVVAAGIKDGRVSLVPEIRELKQPSTDILYFAWALGLDCTDHERVFLLVNRTALYSYHIGKDQLVHIADLKEKWLPMDKRIFPYQSDAATTSNT